MLYLKSKNNKPVENLQEKNVSFSEQEVNFLNNFTSVGDFLDNCDTLLSTFSSLKGAIIKNILKKNPEGLVGNDYLRLKEKIKNLENRVGDLRVEESHLLDEMIDKGIPVSKDLLNRLKANEKSLLKLKKLRNEFGILGSYLSNPNSEKVYMYGTGLVSDPTIYRKASEFKNFSLSELENVVDCLNFNFSLAGKIVSNISKDSQKVKDLVTKHYIKLRQSQINELNLRKKINEMIKSGSLKNNPQVIEAYNSVVNRADNVGGALRKLAEKSKLDQSLIVYNEPISSWNRKLDDALEAYNNL